MRLMNYALAATALCALPTVANATITPTLGAGAGGTAVTLSSAGLNGGTVATLQGGTVYTSDQPFADIPKGGVNGGTFLAAGPTSGNTATLSFTRPTTYLGFLWGSPDAYNVLTLITNLGTYTYTAAGLNFTTTDGNQAVSQYVSFAATAGEVIYNVRFSNTPSQDAFESANFSVTAVPEPATWAMMLLGFGMVAGAVRYRRRTNVVYA